MKNLFSLSFALVIVFSFCTFAIASNTANQTVTFEVSAINEFAVTGAPTLTIIAATAGSEPTAVTDATSTYSVTTNSASNKKITAAINPAMPTGVTLSVNLTSTNGSSLGEKSLSTSAADVVENFLKEKESGSAITYSLAATTVAGVVGSSTTTVTFTLADQ